MAKKKKETYNLEINHELWTRVMLLSYKLSDTITKLRCIEDQLDNLTADINKSLSSKYSKGKGKM